MSRPSDRIIRHMVEHLGNFSFSGASPDLQMRRFGSKKTAMGVLNDDLLQAVKLALARRLGRRA